LSSKTERGSIRWKHPVRDVLVVVVGLFVIGLTYVVLWAYTARPGMSIDYTEEIAELVRSRQPAGVTGGVGTGGGEGAANAWVILKEAIAAYETALASVATTTPGGATNAVEWDLLRDGYQQEVDESPAGDGVSRAAYIVGLDARRGTAEAGIPILAGSPLTGALERLAGTRGGERQGYTAPLFTMLLPELGGSRQMARYLAARMRLAGTTGDSATVLACFEHTMAVARVLAHQACMIDRFAAFAVSTWGMQEIRRYAQGGSMSADDARAALAVMDRQLAWPGLDLPFEGERLMGHDLVQFMHSSGGLIPGRLLTTQYEPFMGGPSSTGPLTPLKNLTGLLAPSRAQTTIALDELYDRMIQHAARTPEERAASGFSMDGYVDSLRGPQPAIKLIVPALGTILEAADAHARDVAGTRARLEALLPEVRRRGAAGGEEP